MKHLMKKVFVALAIGLASVGAIAEATFEQMQTLIEQRNYAAAEQGLEVIIKNHPNSSKAFYAMAQAQAGLGNMDKAKFALNRATGLNPTLDFAPSSSVEKLRQAITPQVDNIVAVEESHIFRNMLYGLLAISVIAVIVLYIKRKEEEARKIRERAAEQEQAKREAQRKKEWQEMVAKQEVERKAVKPSKTVKPSMETSFGNHSTNQSLPNPNRKVRTTYDTAPTIPSASTFSPTPTVIHSSSNTDMLTGVLLGSMMSSNHSGHDRVVEREVIREVPVSRTEDRSSTWEDDTPKASSSSSRSSSWDDDSSSKSASSWSSSSNDSGSSSSWSSSDSSSSSGSSSSSSSSWD